MSLIPAATGQADMPAAGLLPWMKRRMEYHSSMRLLRYVIYSVVTMSVISWQPIYNTSLNRPASSSTASRFTSTCES